MKFMERRELRYQNYQYSALIHLWELAFQPAVSGSPGIFFLRVAVKDGIQEGRPQQDTNHGNYAVVGGAIRNQNPDTAPHRAGRASAGFFRSTSRHPLGQAAVQRTQTGTFSRYWETGSGKKTSIRRVYDAATDDGSQNGDFGEFLWRNFGEVVGKNDEVGVLAGFQRTLLPFLELRVGRA